MRRNLPHRANRGSAALQSIRLLPNYQNNNLGWCEAPQAVEHPRDTENPPGTPSGRRPRLEIAKSPVERLFPPSGGSLTREREGRGRNFSFTVLRLFFWLQKKRGKYRPGDGSAEENCGAVNQSKRYTVSRIQPLSLFVPLGQKDSSPCTGEPRSALHFP